jgi:hypothetical protein
MNVLALVAALATAPAVPVAAQQNLAARSPQLAYVPASAPSGYRYAIWRWRQNVGEMHVTFRNGARKTIDFVAEWQYGRCTGGKQKTFAIARTSVSWAQHGTQQRAWRCIAGSGIRIELAASTAQPASALVPAALARAVASMQHVRLHS